MPGFHGNNDQFSQPTTPRMGKPVRLAAHCCGKRIEGEKQTCMAKFNIDSAPRICPSISRAVTTLGFDLELISCGLGHLQQVGSFGQLWEIWCHWSLVFHVFGWKTRPFRPFLLGPFETLAFNKKAATFQPRGSQKHGTNWGRRQHFEALVAFELHGFAATGRSFGSTTALSILAKDGFLMMFNYECLWHLWHF